MERIVDIATDGQHLAAYRGFMTVSAAGKEVGRVAMDDIAAVIVHGHGVTWSTSLMVKLAERGAVAVLCGSNHAPKALMTAINGHHHQNARIRAQCDAGKPLMKRLWQHLIRTKIIMQGTVAAHSMAAEAGQPDGIKAMAKRVASGDPQNLEAQAARRYWPLIMGSEFRRDRAAPGVNGLLNYGYTVLRALAARAVIASGLHPSIGIHHGNAKNAFALADDVMEPFRPYVDAVTLVLVQNGIKDVNPSAKRAYARLIAADVPGPRGISTLSLAVTRTSQSLATAFEANDAGALDLPTPPSSLDLAGLSTLLDEP